ncbi:MAG: glycosyltransferase [FCB group bacterium]|nr:glycosyltransferase [FCB group bacterium]
MKLIILNYPYLADELRKLGVQVHSAGTRTGCDRIYSPEDYTIHSILEESPFDPDFIVFMDSIERQVPFGLENSPVPLVNYFIDSPINRFWQFPLAEAGDINLFDQKSEADDFSKLSADSYWFPLAVDNTVYKLKGVVKEFDIAFVGGRNPLTRQKRENILKTISQHFNLKIFDGNPRLSPGETAEVYNRSRLVLNETLFPAMNLRLFEAMACGSAVLTEYTAPGLEVAFTDCVHLIGYSPDNLFDRIGYHLDNESDRELIAVRGYEKIRTNHTLTQRAVELKEILAGYERGQENNKSERLSALADCVIGLGLKWGGKNPHALQYAAGLLDQSLSIESTAGALITKGKLSWLAGDIREADKCFDTATKLAPHDYRPYLFSAMASGEIGDAEKSARRFRQAADAAEVKPPDNFYKKPGSPEFHHFWGNVLKDNDCAMEPGLMKFQLPPVFWSALEHFRCAAERSSRYGEDLGDLLLDGHAPDAALQAYSFAKERISDRKRETAERQAYIGLTNNVARANGNCLLSLCMIVKNEEQNLRELLSSIGDIPDQIVVGDTGSDDNTVRVASEYGAEVIKIPWLDDFADARNRTLDKARGRYVIYLDGDDRVNPDELKAMKHQLKSASAEIFYVKLQNTGNNEISLQKRVFPNRPDLRFKGAIHEQIIADPAEFKFVRSELTVFHRGYDDPEALRLKSFRNLKILETELIRNPDDYYLHYHAAICRMNLRQDTNAVEHLKKIVFNDDPMIRDVEIFETSVILLAKIFKRLGDKKTAVKLLQSIPEGTSASPLIHYHLGVNYFEEQLYAECRLEMEEFFRGKIEPGGIPVTVEKTRGWAHYYLGRCLERQGHFDRALKNYRDSIELLERPAKLYIDISRIMSKTGRIDDAIANLKICLAKHPQSRAAKKLLESLAAERAGCQ